MTKFVDSLGLKRLVTKIAEAVSNGTWLPVKAGRDADGNVVEGAVVEGSGSIASGYYAHAEGGDNIASGESSHAEGERNNVSGDLSHAEGSENTVSGNCAHAEGSENTVSGYASHVEGSYNIANGSYSHTEGLYTKVSGYAAHAEGYYNYDDASFVHMIGVGNNPEHKGVRKNAVAVYMAFNKESEDTDPTDPKNGYQYLLGVGGYQGQAIAEGMKSVQEVIADLEKGVEAASETMTVEDIREIMSV